MSLPPILQGLPLPVVGSPMFIVSGPELVIAQCKAGIVGTFPALNARPSGTLNSNARARSFKTRVQLVQLGAWTMQIAAVLY